MNFVFLIVMAEQMTTMMTDRNLLHLPRQQEDRSQNLNLFRTSSTSMLAILYAASLSLRVCFNLHRILTEEHVLVSYVFIFGTQEGIEPLTYL